MLPDKSYYEVDRESFLSIKPLSQRLSSAHLDYDYSPNEEFYKVANNYVLSTFHSMFEFVAGEKSPMVVIDPETSTSFCSITENKIQLGTVLFANPKFSQQQRVDGMIAVMFHEMWHKRYTNTDIRNRLSLSDTDLYNKKASVQHVKGLLPTSGHVDVLNILEDYRIEKLGLRQFPGYVFYFDSLREVVIEFQQGKKFKPDLSSLVIEYLMFKVLIPEMLDWYIATLERKLLPNVITTAKSYFLKIDRYFTHNSDLVYSDDFNKIMQATTEIVKLLPPGNDGPPSNSKYSGVASENYMEMEMPGDDTDYESAVVEVKKSLAENAERIAREHAKMMSDDVKVRIEQNQILSAHDSKFEDIFIYNPIPGPLDQELINEAKTISNHISRDLGFLASKLNQKNEFFELSEGDLDEDELYSIGFSKNIFMDEEPRPGFELDFGILIDESYSMATDDKIKKAKAACIGIARPCLESSHVNLFVYGHSQRTHDEGVNLQEYVNTKRRLNDWRTILSSMALGGNADGYAIAKVGEIMLRDSQCRQKVLVVISDGMPSAIGYGGELAEKHVMSVVNFLEIKGIQVIQLCIDNIDRSKYMFKHYIPFDGQGKFGRNLREIMHKRLQQFLESF